MIERRTGRRFDVNWPIRVECGEANQTLSTSGELRNISSGGASLWFGELPGSLCAGMKLDVYIKLPLKRDNWMKYTAEVLRVNPGQPGAAAIRFDGSRPIFG